MFPSSLSFLGSFSFVPFSQTLPTQGMLFKFVDAKPGEVFAVHFNPLKDKNKPAFGILHVLDDGKVSLKYDICGN